MQFLDVGFLFCAVALTLCSAAAAGTPKYIMYLTGLVFVNCLFNPHSSGHLTLYLNQSASNCSTFTIGQRRHTRGNGFHALGDVQ